MPRKLEKINLKSMILTISLLSGLTLTSVSSALGTGNAEIQRESRNPNVVEVIRKDEGEEDQEKLI